MMTAQNIPPLFQQLIKVFSDIPFNRMLGLELESLEENKVVVSFSMKEELVGNYIHKILHGGVTSSVLDMAGGMAVMSAAIHKHHNKSVAELSGMLSNASTIDIHVNYLRPGKGERFRVEACVLQSGNKISFARMELYNQDSVLIASGSGTYAVG